jgi:serine/threonine protein kinase
MKLENLLLTADKQTCKVCDFGLAKNLTAEAAKTVIGTAKYVSPEVLAGTGTYDALKADMWSCGVCLYCMVECRFPFSKSGNDGVGGHGVHAQSASDAELMRYLMQAKYPLKGTESPEFVEFMSRLLSVDVERRYTAVEALSDPWVLGRDWTAEHVAEQVAALDTSAATVPGDFTSREAWLAKVEELAGGASAAAAGEEEEKDEEEDGF